MRYRDEQLNAADELREGAHSYVVERVEQPAHEHALGHAWVRLVDE